MGPLQSLPVDRFTPVRLTISILNTVVGCFVLFRMPVSQHGSAPMIAVALPSLIVAGFAFKLSPAPHLWPVYAEILFAVGGSLAVWAFLFLGRSFAILPAIRNIVVRGPYRLVRHPAYLGELLMILACAIASPSLLGVIPFLVGIPLIVIRILAEEKLLHSKESYRQYCKKVGFRLVPRIW